MSLLYSAKLWRISEKELRKETEYLGSLPEFQHSGLSETEFTQTIKKLAEKNIILYRLIAFCCLILLVIAIVVFLMWEQIPNPRRLVRLCVVLVFSCGIGIVQVYVRLKRLKELLVRRKN